MDKTVFRREFENHPSAKEDTLHWRSRTVEERFMALEALKLAVYGSVPRLHRIRR